MKWALSRPWAIGSATAMLLIIWNGIISHFRIPSCWCHPIFGSSTLNLDGDSDYTGIDFELSLPPRTS